MNRLVDSKGQECSCCKEYKAYSEYGAKKSTPSGYRGMCRSCRSATRLLKRNGTVEKIKRVSKITPDEVMNRISNRLYNKKRLEYIRLFKDNSRSCRKCRKCRKCKETKLNCDFEYMGKKSKHSSPYSKLCDGCRGGLNVKDYAKVAKVMSSNKSRNNKLKKKIGVSEANAIHGFVYLYWSEVLRCFKIGRTKYSPFHYIKSKSNEYGLQLDMVAFIVCPIRDVDIEWYVTKGIKSKIVKHIKPCGGITRELFKCDILDILRVFRSITDKIYIEPSPFISIDDIGGTTLSIEELEAVCGNKRKKYVPSEGVIIKKMFKANKPIHLNGWRYFKSVYYRTVRCYANNERVDGKFEAGYDKEGVNISLGLFGSYEAALNTHKEFKEFLIRERCFRDRKLSRLRSGVRSPRVKRFLASQN